jgi:hypothetical protein
MGEGAYDGTICSRKERLAGRKAVSCGCRHSAPGFLPGFRQDLSAQPFGHDVGAGHLPAVASRVRTAKPARH